MGNDTGICMREEFATLDFNSSRLEKRFVKTMETSAGQPDKSIWGHAVKTALKPSHIPNVGQ